MIMKLGRIRRGVIVTIVLVLFYALATVSDGNHSKPFAHLRAHETTQRPAKTIQGVRSAIARIVLPGQTVPHIHQNRSPASIEAFRDDSGHFVPGLFDGWVEKEIASIRHIESGPTEKGGKDTHIIRDSAGTNGARDGNDTWDTQAKWKDRQQPKTKKDTDAAPPESRGNAHPANESIEIVPPSILIVTNRFSGSNFLGQLFNQHSDIFYNFEPLKVLDEYPGIYSNQSSVLGPLLSCRFERVSQLVELYNKDSLHRASSSALVTPPLCTSNNTVSRKNVKKCEKLVPAFAASVCDTRYKYNAAVVIRLEDIRALKELVTRDRLNLKIIHLVRDPRGILSSRSRAENGGELELGDKLDNDARYLCSRLKSNIERADANPLWMRGRYTRVRHEDVLSDPRRWARELYRFAGLGQVPPEVHGWIRANVDRHLASGSNGKMKEDHPTKINSTKNVQELWRRKLSQPVVRRVEDICEEVMELMHYDQLVRIRPTEEIIDLDSLERNRMI